MIKGNTGSSKGFSGAPTIIILPWAFSKKINGTREWTADTVLMIPSMLPMEA